MKHEAVGLRFGQRIRAFLLDRILGGEHQEGLGQRIGGVADGHLPLLHRFEQGRLHLGRRSIDLVGEHQIGEDRPLLGREFLLARIEDQRAGQVGGQQVGRELHARELGLDRIGHGLDGQRLGEPGNALKENMPTGEQTDEHTFDHVLLADDHLADLVLKEVDKRRLLLNHPHQGPDVGRGSGLNHRFLPAVKDHLDAGGKRRLVRPPPDESRRSCRRRMRRGTPGYRKPERCRLDSLGARA